MKPEYCYECRYFFYDVFGSGRCSHHDKCNKTEQYSKACNLAQNKDLKLKEQ